MTHDKPTEPRRLYGRRQGRPLNESRQTVLDEVLPKLSLTLPSDEGPLPLPGGRGQRRSASNEDRSVNVVGEGKRLLNPQSLFPAPRAAIWMEIGFGNGEHVAAMMRAQPENGFIACEPFINGMSAFLKQIKDEPHDHVRVWMDDAIRVVDSLTPGSLAGIYVLNPDPWPKKRHFKRRIISQTNLDKFAHVLEPGGQLIMTTDVDDLAEWMVTQASNHPAFEWQAERAADWQTAPAGWLPTRYETKGIKAGRKQSYLLFRKKDESK